MAAISMARKTSMTTRRVPTAIAAMPSHRPSPVITAALTPTRAKTRPHKAPRYSSRVTGSSG